MLWKAYDDANNREGTYSRKLTRDIEPNAVSPPLSMVFLAYLVSKNVINCQVLYLITNKANKMSLTFLCHVCIKISDF